MDKVNKLKYSKYDMIIGSDILNDLHIDLLYSEERVRWKSSNNLFRYNLIPIEELGSMSDKESCAIVYDLHTTTPMLQTEEDRLGKILDTDYSKVDIDNMVDGLTLQKQPRKN